MTTLQASTQFKQPQKRIFDSQTTSYFQHSLAIQRVRHYLKKYILCMTGRPIPKPNYTPHFTTTKCVVALLDTLFRLFQETPPLQGPRRYGNLADRTWHDKKHTSIRGLIETILKGSKAQTMIKDQVGLLDELQYYIENAFGSKIRLDFGTGHELSFMAFIASLDMLQLWEGECEGDEPLDQGKFSTDLIFIWNKYYHLVKSLILTYNLEPAGSHGVWGLDDHFHLVYIWGASQWIEQEDLIAPRDLVSRQQCDFYKDENFFSQAISFICHVKTGPFREHSPILNNILTTVRSWKKIQRGLLRMYDDEVLNKFPVVQHFWFGSGFFPWVDVRSGKELPIFEGSPESQEQDQEQKEARHLNSFVSMAGNSNGIVDFSSTTTVPPTTTAFSTAGATTSMSHPLSGARTMGPPSMRNVNRFLPMDPTRDRLRRRE
ncbi:serine/threonine-protein phosphatase 2A activator 1 [Monosporozyma unispora]|nr:Serine/threonine-protein phosphatase 2A activator 1 [Kazachstania unispora]